MNRLGESYIPTEAFSFACTSRKILKDSPLYAEYVPETFDMFIALVEIAYEISQHIHIKDTRRMGNLPYFTHPLAVAKIILEDFPMPSVEKIAIALVHDILEDHREVTKDALKKMFVSKWKLLFPGKKMPEEVKTAIGDIIFGAEVLSKKERKDTLSLLEKPFFYIEQRHKYLLKILPPEKTWHTTTGKRVDFEYKQRMHNLAEERRYLFVVAVKLADKYHNSSTSHEENISRIQAMIDSIQETYLPIAEKLSFENAIELLSKELVFLRKTLTEKKAQECLQAPQASMKIPV